jgi:hypothetical protein
MQTPPAIVAVAYNRPHSLDRLLGSLDAAQYPAGTQVPLIISIDHGDNQDVLALAEAFDWRHGEKQVIYQPQNLGLKAHILACGNLAEQYGAVILLEDDLYVSPQFYQFSLQSLAFYDDDPLIKGISLYNHRANVHADNLPFIPVEDGNDVYFMQMPSSWGQVWKWEWWQDFRAWLAEHEEVRPEEKISPFVRSWPKSSWLKHKIRYLTQKGYFYVYPRQSLASNFGDSGTNFAENSTLYQVPLLFGGKSWQFGPLSDALAVYDAFFEWHGSKVKACLPELGEAAVECNLYGCKVLDQYDESTLFVSLFSTASTELSFGLEMRPAEQNLMQRIPGQKIRIAQRRHLEAANGSEDSLYKFFYQQIPLGRAVELAKRQFKHKWDYYVRKRI